MSKTRTYRIWKNMKQRCLNENCPHFPAYGGRGIGIQPDWLGFAGFYADVLDAPDGLSIDRIDNDAGYGPRNWRWATPAMQAANRRPKSKTKRAAPSGTP